jgi:hypothetical protein
MDRKSITVTKMLQEVKLDKVTVYKCMAEVDGAEIKLETFDKQIGEKLVEGLKAEVEITEKESKDKSYINHIINQMWINGEPVKQPKKEWKKDDDSPEKRLSIERQSYMANIPGVMNCDRIPAGLRERIIGWGYSLFDDRKPPQENIKETPVKEPKKPVKATTEDEKPAKAITDEDKEKADNFMLWAKNKYGLGDTEIWDMMEVKNQYEIKNLSKAAKDLDALMKE